MIGEFEKESNKIDNVNYKDVTEDKIKSKTIKKIISETCDISEWKKINTCESKIVKKNNILFLSTNSYNNSKIVQTSIELERSSCKKHGTFSDNDVVIYKCLITSHGLIDIYFIIIV